eukprot:7220337-Pyramimonas_sp.AAC.1
MSVCVSVSVRPCRYESACVSACVSVCVSVCRLGSPPSGPGFRLPPARAGPSPSSSCASRFNSQLYALYSPHPPAQSLCLAADANKCVRA